MQFGIFLEGSVLTVLLVLYVLFVLKLCVRCSILGEGCFRQKEQLMKREEVKMHG